MLIGLFAAAFLTLISILPWPGRKYSAETIRSILIVGVIGLFLGWFLALMIGDNRVWPMSEVGRTPVIEYTTDSRGYAYRVDLGEGRSQWLTMPYSYSVIMVKEDRDDIVLVTYQEEMPADEGLWFFNPFPDRQYEFHLPAE